MRQDRPAIPETRYAKAGDGVHIAYQVTGAGPLDVVMVPGFVSHVELAWDMPFYASMFRRVGSFARVIPFDKRGTGLSDRTADVPTLGAHRSGLKPRQIHIRRELGAYRTPRSPLM